MSYETLIVEQKGAVTLITLNRPQALNALNSTVCRELGEALAAYGHDRIPANDQSQILWRDALAKKLVSLQKVDSKTGQGFWVNSNNRFWEANDILVTSYTLLALEVAIGK